MHHSPPPSYETTLPSSDGVSGTRGAGEDERRARCLCAPHWSLSSQSSSSFSPAPVTAVEPGPFSHDPSPAFSLSNAHVSHEPLLQPPIPSAQHSLAAASATTSTSIEQQQRLAVRHGHHESEPNQIPLNGATYNSHPYLDSGQQSVPGTSASDGSLAEMEQTSNPPLAVENHYQEQLQQPHHLSQDQDSGETRNTTSLQDSAQHEGSDDETNTLAAAHVQISGEQPPSPTSSTISSTTIRVDQQARPSFLPLGPLSNFHPQRDVPTFNPADEPPPYSPTHTILPHYFSLVPIPIRSYSIKESPTLPGLLDFWLHTTSTSHGTRPTSPAPQEERLQLQDRGLPPQFNGPERKYSLIRPTQPDRTAIPPGHPSFTSHTFIPPWALVSAEHPGRWMWWGTEALHLVVFGRQLKNVYMEWRWRRARSRIGGPVVTRLIGCSFRMTPERGYCWRQGTGRATNLTMGTPTRQRSLRREAMESNRRRELAHTVVNIGSGHDGGRNRATQDEGVESVVSVADSSQRQRQQTATVCPPAATSGSVFSRLFRSRRRAADTADSPLSSVSNNNLSVVTVEMHQIPMTTPDSTSHVPDPALATNEVPSTSLAPSGTTMHRAINSASVESPPTAVTPHGLEGGESTPALSDIDEGDLQRRSTVLNNEDEEEGGDGDAGIYHCREESIEGVPGRLVAIYRPARTANRSRDLPARSCKLEIYAEIGERCETALMSMCTRLDDLFMSIPESKRMPVRRRQRGGRSGSSLASSSPLASPAITTAGGGESLAAIGRQGEGELSRLARGGGSDDVEQQPLQSSTRSNLKRFLRRNRTRWFLKIVVAIILIVVTAVLILRSSRSKK